jgi:hypothetical protein
MSAAPSLPNQVQIIAQRLQNCLGTLFENLPNVLTFRDFNLFEVLQSYRGWDSEEHENVAIVLHELIKPTAGLNNRLNVYELFQYSQKQELSASEVTTFENNVNTLFNLVPLCVSSVNVCAPNTTLPLLALKFNDRFKLVVGDMGTFQFTVEAKSGPYMAVIRSGKLLQLQLEGKRNESGEVEIVSTLQSMQELGETQMLRHLFACVSTFFGATQMVVKESNVTEMIQFVLRDTQNSFLGNQFDFQYPVDADNSYEHVIQNSTVNTCINLQKALKGPPTLSARDFTKTKTIPGVTTQTLLEYVTSSDVVAKNRLYQYLTTLIKSVLQHEADKRAREEVTPEDLLFHAFLNMYQSQQNLSSDYVKCKNCSTLLLLNVCSTTVLTFQDLQTVSQIAVQYNKMQYLFDVTRKGLRKVLLHIQLNLSILEIYLKTGPDNVIESGLEIKMHQGYKLAKNKQLKELPLFRELFMCISNSFKVSTMSAYENDPVIIFKHMFGEAQNIFISPKFKFQFVDYSDYARDRQVLLDTPMNEFFTLFDVKHASAGTLREYLTTTEQTNFYESLILFFTARDPYVNDLGNLLWDVYNAHKTLTSRVLMCNECV